MWHATFKSLWARKARLILSALSIVLGVAFVCGSLMFTNLLSSSFDELVKGTLADVNVSTETTGITGFNDPGGIQGLLTEDDVAKVQAVDGVQKAVGIVSNAQVFPLDKDGRLLSFQGAPGIAMNWHDTPAAGGLDGARIVEGREPQSDDEVVIDPATAARGEYVVGDTIEVATPRSGLQSFTIVGTGTYGAGSTAGASYLFFTIDAAREVARDGEPGFDSMFVQTTAEADVDTVAAAVGDVLPDGFAAETGNELSENIQEQLDVGLGFINIFLLVFAGIALLVATLLILNTFSILVAQRQRELALFRAIGATRSQIRSSVLTEALVVGLLGATLGLLAGYGLVWGILALLKFIGLELGSAVPSFTWQAVVASYAIGIVITMLAAYAPARKASATRPVQAMAAAAQSGPEKVGGLPMVGLAIAQLGIAAVVCAVLLDVASPLIWFGVGAALLLIGIVVSAAIVGRPLIWLFGKLFRAGFGEIGKLAQLNSVRQPRRTAATAATLMIGLALVSTVAILATSTTTSIRERLASDQRGDFLIAPVAYQPFDAAVVERTEAVDGVESVYTFARTATVVDGEPVTVTGATPEGLTRGTSLNITAGSLEADGDAEPAIVSTGFASEQNLTLGKLFDLPSLAGPVRVLITGIHDGGSATSVGDVIVTPETYAKVGDPGLVQTLVIFLEEGADEAAVREGLYDATEELPAVVVSDVSEYIETRVGQFSQLFSILYALLALAIVISVLGIVNTLGLSVMERTRELGLLRAVGMTRPQLRRMVTLESVIVATLGAALGVVLGLVFGAGLVTLLRDEGIDHLVISWWQMVLFVAVAALFGVLAAVGPARRAAKLNVLESIAAE